MYKETELKDVRATGWAYNFLKTQSNGLTGEIGRVGAPFSDNYWGSPDKTDFVGYFIGGMATLNDAWVPYEQTGYWIDGAIRAGYLIDDEKLINLAREKIIAVLEQADSDGYLGPDFLKDGMVWAHSVFFRAISALYSQTKDDKILEALKKHYLRVPLKDVYEKSHDQRIMDVRNVADIEMALWLFGQTGDDRLLTAAEESYEVFNNIFSNDKDAPIFAKMRQLTIKGMLSNRKANQNHGVTYCELCKLAAILHMYTGKEIYKKAAINAFDKVYRDQMLIDGVISSTEYLNGNTDSHAMHETCDISDFTWALGYLYMITGDAKYGDWVENAIFNGGFGAIDDDFKGEQYFSCPNQAIANDTSNHAVFFRGSDWMSYAPKSFLGCCAGNVHRFFPNYVLRSWMKNDKEISVFTYVPSKYKTVIQGKCVEITEITDYPFENTIKFIIKTESEVDFNLKLRIPNWAINSTLTVNGEICDCYKKGAFYNINKTFSKTEEITIAFEDKIEFINNAKGISVKKGPLLYALPIKEKVVVEGLRECGNEDFPRYSLYPESNWNYAMDRDAFKEAKFVGAKVGHCPWKRKDNSMVIELPLWELKNQQLQKLTSFKRRLVARGKCMDINETIYITPKVKDVNKEELNKRCIVKLVPYATTRLRMTIFPKIK